MILFNIYCIGTTYVTVLNQVYQSPGLICVGAVLHNTSPLILEAVCCTSIYCCDWGGTLYTYS